MHIKTFSFLSVETTNSREHFGVCCPLVALEEGPEGGVLLRAALDGGQDHGVVVYEVHVRLQLARELHEDVAQALVRTPVRQTVL